MGETDSGLLGQVCVNETILELWSTDQKTHASGNKLCSVMINMLFLYTQFCSYIALFVAEASSKHFT